MATRDLHGRYDRRFLNDAGNFPKASQEKPPGLPGMKGGGTVIGAAKLSRLLEIVSEACLAGGKSLMSLYLQPEELGVRQKNLQDPRTVVCQADINSERAIIRTFRTSLECSFLSEEAGELPSRRTVKHPARSRIMPGRYRVIIDSLDGTKNYVEGAMGLFGVSIGVERERQILAGAISLPYFGEDLLAERGKGAFLRRHGKECGGSPAGVSSLKKSARQVPLHNARVCIARGGAAASVLSQPPLSVLLGACNEAVNYGSCSVGLANVTLGRIDALVLPCQKYWDFAGGYTILKEIGASFAVWQDSWSKRVAEERLTQAGSSDYFDIVAARSPDLFREIMEIIKESPCQSLPD